MKQSPEQGSKLQWAPCETPAEEQAEAAVTVFRRALRSCTKPRSQSKTDRGVRSVRVCLARVHLRESTAGGLGSFLWVAAFDFFAKAYNASGDSMQGVLKLASRFGKTYHRSYVRRKLEQLRACAPESTGSFEEWLIKLAKLRANKVPGAPSLRDVPNEELTVALLLLENLDHQGLLESAAVMLSRRRLPKRTGTSREARTGRFSAFRAHGRGFKKIGHATCFPATALVRATPYRLACSHVLVGYPLRGDRLFRGSQPLGSLTASRVPPRCARLGRAVQKVKTTTGNPVSASY